jgi:hypothetical protein
MLLFLEVLLDLTIHLTIQAVCSKDWLPYHDLLEQPINE